MMRYSARHTWGWLIFINVHRTTDSAFYYAKQSLDLAKKDGFLNWQLNAATFLTDLYKTNNNIDSAFLYLSRTQQLNDSLNGKDNIRKIQLLSSNENLRQLEMAEKTRIAAKERKQQLQLLFIGIFIPGFFLLTLLLSRIRIHTRIVKALGILSLLILFEYLLLLLHPTVAELTNPSSFSAPPPAVFTVVPLDSDQECAQALAAGRTDFQAYATSVTVVNANIAAGIPVMQVGKSVYSEDLAAAFDKASTLPTATLRAEVDKLFTAMHSDGRLSDLSTKWFSEDLTKVP